VLVEDDTMVEAMQLIFQLHGLVLEPAGAAGVAAAMVFRDKFRGRRVATLLSGGNTSL
jgi:threonine dehydratase